MAIMVLVTVPKNEAEPLAKILLEKRVCACVNITGEVKSFFWWQGKINEEKEALLTIKTKNSSFQALKELIEKHHSYDTPEIIAFKIDKINDKYLNWLKEEVND